MLVLILNPAGRALWWTLAGRVWDVNAFPHRAKRVRGELIAACSNAPSRKDSLLHDGITTDELDRAREGYLQARKVGRGNDAALAGTLGSLRHLGRTMAWESDLEKRISGLTPEQVKSALNHCINPKKLVVVTAGDFQSKSADANGQLSLPAAPPSRKE